MLRALFVSLAVLALITVVIRPVSAQERRIPMLVVPPQENAQPLTLATVKTEVKILGYLAETRMTMTFFNPNQRVLAGDLSFPLPEGATVSGYALDIGGVMVDGVVVEKHKARQVYEKIVRQGIDPGLVEWVKGNNFKTRVFPILPQGTRTIMVRYLSELVHDPKGTSYHLPLSFTEPVKDFSLRVEVVKPAAKPMITQGDLANFSFEKWRDSFVAETTLSNQAHAKDLVIALPDVERQKILVEKDPDGEYYFVINDFPALPDKERAKLEKKAPGRIVIFWDASGSRGKEDHKRELKLLEKYLGTLRDNKIDVDVVLFRNEAEKAQRFVIEKGNAEKLIAALTAVEYDGGTQMGCIAPDSSPDTPDFYLLFSDGLSTFGKEEPAGLKAPMYALSASSGANHSFLRYLSQQTGGEYFNLNRADDETVVSRIGASPYSFISALSEAGGTDDVYPKTSQPAFGRLSLAGKLKTEKARVTLTYGIKGNELSRVDYEISRSAAGEGSLLRLFWAQKKIDELLVFQKRNENELIAVGKEYGLVTPGTSLIVLENLQQYVEHKIAPPTSLPEMRQRYFAMIETQQRKEQERVVSKIDQVVAMWQKRVDWWNSEFRHTKDFKHTPTDQATRNGARLPPRPPAAAQPSRVAPRSEGEMSNLGAPAERRAPETAAQQALPESPRPAVEPEAVTGAMGRRRSGGDTPREAKLEKGKADEPGAPSPAAVEGSIAIKEWDPSTPYLTKLKEAKPEAYLAVYMEQRKTYGTSPAFFLDCADFLFKQKQDALAVRVLSNIAELELENPHLLRVLGHRLAQANLLEPARMVFEEVLRLRPEEPQSYRDLGLVLDSLGQFPRAVEVLYKVVTNTWDRFQEIEVVTLMELNRTIARAKRAGVRDFPVDPRLVKLLDLDVRIVLTWDADMTDMDLWVTEPSGEKASFQHKLTGIGGLVSRDITDGYGPEEYVLKKALKGKYNVQANYYGSGSPSLTGAVTLQVEVFTNYGRPEETRRALTLRLKERQEMISVGEIEFR